MGVLFVSSGDEGKVQMELIRLTQLADSKLICIVNCWIYVEIYT